MSKQDIDLLTIWNSKLAKRLIPTFVLVVAIPLAVTVLVVGRVGQQQIVVTARSLEVSNEATVMDAGMRFHRLGQSALQRSSYKIADICQAASLSASKQSERDQATSLAASGRDFATVTQNCFDGAMHRSLTSNKLILADIGAEMGNLFANSAHFTDDRVGARVQGAILTQINSQMSERASQLAQMCDSYVATNVNYLGLTAEMLNLQGGNPASQRAVLDALVRRFPMLSVVTVLDKTGQVTLLSATNRIETPTDLVNQASAPYFKAAIVDQTYVGIDRIPADGSAPTLRLAVPIELYRGNVVGVLSAALSLEDLWDTLRRVRFGASGFVYVDNNGARLLLPHRVSGPSLEQSAAMSSTGWKIVVAEPQSEVMQPIDSFRSDIVTNTKSSISQMHNVIQHASNLATIKLLSTAAILRVAAAKQLRSQTASILHDLEKRTIRKNLAEQSGMQTAIHSQIIHAQSENDHLMMVATKTASTTLMGQIPRLTQSALLLGNQRLGFFATTIFIVSCAMSCLIGLLLTGALVRPIIQLSQGTMALASGDLDERVDERAPAEIGDLAVAFNRMAASLQKSRSDLSDAESQLVQSAKLASLGTLSAGVAHELNQPVAIVRGIAQQYKNDDDIPQEVREDLGIIEGQTSRMMKIITHLRTFCRSGGYEMVIVDINRVIRDCFILIEAQLKNHGVAVELDLAEESPTLLGDANELEQVFINLITNARDALEGTVRPCLTITSRICDKSVIVEFKDNGPGIPESAAAHIFDPFFTTKDVGKGTGLGLSISHGLIQKHHGSITAKNDGGAVFTITIPLAHPESVDQLAA